VLPRTVAFELEAGRSAPLEISSKVRIETRQIGITVYSTMRGDIADMLEVLYGGLHGGGDLLSFPNGVTAEPIAAGKVHYDNFIVTYHRPFRYDGRIVYSASLSFDVVVTRSG
jgi:hypothetical protein